MAKATAAKAKSTSTNGKSKGKGKEEEKAKKVLPTRANLDKMKMGIPVVIDGQSMIGSKKQFKKGSVGYNVSGKIIIDGIVCQVSANIIAVGSKELAKQEGFVVGGDEDEDE